MTEKRNITKKDIYIKARILSEGIRKTARGKVGANITDLAARPIVFDGCDIVCATPQNKYSRLEMKTEGERVTISDMGEVLVTGCLEPRPAWRDMKLSKGQPVEVVLLGMSATAINLLFYYSCDNWNKGRACRYCGIFAFQQAKEMSDLPTKTIAEMAERQAEAIKIATDNGWRGSIAVSGGAIAPNRQGESLDMLAAVIEPLRKVLDEDVFNQLHIAMCGYPPHDFEEMYEWQKLGYNATKFDLEVLDPISFKTICPGKHAYKPLEYWKEAQEVSTDIFGPGRGTVTSVVVGMEPMDMFIKGFDERLSKGVFPTPLHFIPTRGSVYEGFRPPAAEWIVESAEKMADCYFRHEDKLDCKLDRDNRPGYTRTGRSFHFLLSHDEITRRLQEAGKFPAGLPDQYGSDCPGVSS